MADLHTIASRIASTIFVLALIALVLFFALRAIPKAERPTLQPSGGTSVSSTRP